jgi:hypothetical protein
MLIKASDDNLSWLCEFLKQFFNLFWAENGRSSAALVAGINTSSHNLKICGENAKQNKYFIEIHTEK